MEDTPYEEKQLLALLEFEQSHGGNDFEGAAWSISPTYGRHFHYIPAAKDGLLRLREFQFPKPVVEVQLSVVGRGAGAPEPATLVRQVFAIAMISADNANTEGAAIYKGVEER